MKPKTQFMFAYTEINMKKHSYNFNINPSAFDMAYDVCTPQGTLLERTFSEAVANDVFEHGGAKRMYINNFETGHKRLIKSRDF